METLKLLIISIIQGITELLPISSSAHILLLGDILKIDIPSTLLVTFHLGTTLAILIFFREKIFKDFFTKKKFLFFSKLIVASIPAGITGLLFENIISSKLHSEWIFAISLIFWGIVMIFVERKYTKNESNKMEDFEKVSWKQAVLIGFSQVIALIPGTSRSGITTLTGILLGLKKYTAFEFSFFLSIPILSGTFCWLLIKNHSDGSLMEITEEPVLLNLFVILFVTFLVGFFTLQILKKIQKENWLTFFGIYRIVLGILIILSFYL